MNTAHEELGIALTGSDESRISHKNHDDKAVRTRTAYGIKMPRHWLYTSVRVAYL